jgi:predicted metal-binding membrane protein
LALGPVLSSLLGLVGFAWLAMIVYGGGRTMRLGLLTGGAAFMSMPGMFGSRGVMAGMSSPAASTSASGVASGARSSMLGMHMAGTQMPAAASGAAGSQVHTAAVAMKMTMLGVSISGGDRALSWPVFGLFMFMWLVMVAAMMLPVVLPKSVRYHDTARGPRSPRAMTMEFVSADMAVWVLVGIPAYFGLVALQASFPASGVTAIRVGALLVAAAGAYEFSSFKRRAHERCCVAHRAADQSTTLACCPAAGDSTEAPWRSGLRHGLASIGCCGPVMGVLLLIGMMNVVWMLGVTALMFFERTVLWGSTLGRTVGVALVAIAVVLLVAPRPLPALA